MVLFKFVVTVGFTVFASFKVMLKSTRGGAEGTLCDAYLNRHTCNRVQSWTYLFYNTELNIIAIITNFIIIIFATRAKTSMSSSFFFFNR